MSVQIQVLRDDGSQELECLHCRHSAVYDGDCLECRGGGGGCSPVVHNNLHCFERVELQVV